MASRLQPLRCLCRASTSTCRREDGGTSLWAGRPVELRYAPVAGEVSSLRGASRRDGRVGQPVPATEPAAPAPSRRRSRLDAGDARRGASRIELAHRAPRRRTGHRALGGDPAGRRCVRSASTRSGSVADTRLEHKFVTVVSNLETGEPGSIGRGRREETLRRWLQSLSREQKSTIGSSRWTCAGPYWNAVDNTRGLEHAPIVHDPFHIMKLAGAMLDELRREVFFRAGPELRAIGRGRRWLLLRAWERSPSEDRVVLRRLLARNRTLARGLRNQGGAPRARHLRARSRQHGKGARPDPSTNRALRAARSSPAPRRTERTLQRDRRPCRASPRDRSHRVLEQQLGEARAARARLPEPQLPPAQVAIHAGESDPLERRRSTLPRARPHASHARIFMRHERPDLRKAARS